MQLTSGNAAGCETDRVQEQCDAGHDEYVAQQLRVEEIFSEVLAVGLELGGDVCGGPFAVEERDPAVKQLPGVGCVPVFTGHEDGPGGFQLRDAESEIAEDGCMRCVVSRWRDEVFGQVCELTAGEGAHFGQAEQLSGFITHAGAAKDHGGQPEVAFPGAVHYQYPISI